MPDLSLTAAEQEDLVECLERIDERMEALVGRLHRIAEKLAEEKAERRVQHLRPVSEGDTDA